MTSTRARCAGEAPAAVVLRPPAPTLVRGPIVPRESRRSERRSKRITDATGAVVWDVALRPFGEVAQQSVGSVATNLRFPGQSFDAETGLHYNWFRDYDPSLGRYVESDPIGLLGGSNTKSH
jgi:RHS repeat-associated protein